MKLTKQQFHNWKNKSITLLGMSGVGKTHLSNKLSNDRWFHYSGDYRIGTHYLNEPILDNIKKQAMQVPFLRKLLQSNSIYISNNITIENLTPVSTFIGKLGDPSKDGLSLDEFKYRQNLHREAEIAAMLDVPDFIYKANKTYGIDNFINDAGGSICELDDDNVLTTLDEHTIIVYIKASEKDEKELIQRAISSPKPTYYREEFLDEQLHDYMREENLSSIDQIDPDHFSSWTFVKLFYSRIPRYQTIADKYGYIITTSELKNIKNEHDFLQFIENKM